MSSDANASLATAPQDSPADGGTCAEPELFESRSAQSCPLADAPPKPKREDCQATSLVIRKKNRKLEIKRGDPGHSDDPSNSPCPRFEVVSGRVTGEWLDPLATDWSVEREDAPRHNGSLKREDKAAEITCTLKGLVGPCKTPVIHCVPAHKDHTFDVDFKTKSRSDDKLTFEASAHAAGLLELLPFWAEPKIYVVHANTCSDSFSAEVAVYPEFEAGIGFELKLESEYDLKSAKKTASVELDTVSIGRMPPGNSRDRRRMRRADPKRYPPREFEHTAEYREVRTTRHEFSKKLSLVAIIKVGGVEFEPTPVLRSWVRKVEIIEERITKLFQVIRRFEELDEEAAEFDAASGRAKSATAQDRGDRVMRAAGLASHRDTKKISWPTIRIMFGGTIQEIPDSHQCAFCTRVKIAFKPLIGFSDVWDVTPAILRLLAPLTGGSTIGIIELKSRIDAWLEKQGIAAFKITFELEGKLDGEVCFDWVSGAEYRPSGSLESSVTGTLKAALVEMQVTRSVLGFTVEADVDLSIKGETGFEFEAKIDARVVYGDLEWSGLKVTIATKADVCVGFTEKSQAPPDPEAPPKEKFTEIGKQFTPVESATLFEGELYRYGPESDS